MIHLDPSSNIVFKEKQRFTQWWLWALLLVIMLTFVIGIYNQLILGEPYGNEPLSDVGLIVVSIFFFGMIVLLILIRLTTELTETELKMKFYPFISKRIPWSEVENAVVINYGFVGGWGIRLGSSYGTVYNIKGLTGLSITLKNDEKFIIGTQKSAELKQFMTRLT